MRRRAALAAAAVVGCVGTACYAAAAYGFRRIDKLVAAIDLDR